MTPRVPDAERQITAVKAVLAEELELVDHPTILVRWNKADRVPDRSFVDVLRSHHRDSVAISAASGEGLGDLENAVREALLDRALDAEIEIGVGNRPRVLAYLAQHAQIQTRKYDDDDHVLLQCRLPRRCLDFLSENGASVRQNGQRMYA